jgi:hypothetical protein
VLARALIAEGATVRAFVDVAERRIGGEKAGIPVLGLDALASHREDELILGVAGGRGARAALRAALRARGLEEGRSFFLAQ